MHSSVLALHIAAGIAGLLSGTAAVIFRKGSERHRAYGNVFVISMLMLGLSAAYLSVQTKEFGNLIGGVLTVYLVGTAWSTARHRVSKVGILDWIGLAIALSSAVILFSFGLKAVRTPTHSLAGVPAAMTFFLATLMLLCAVGDIRMIARGGLSGSQRIARHLWRMCFALFVASGSFFLGRIRIFPHAIRELYIPWFLAFLPLLLMIFWLIRVRVTSRPSQKVEVQAA